MQNHLKLLFTLLLVASAAYAQKLPNKQEASIWAPADLKMDGKALEWNNMFQAYNRATDFFYTMANNDDILYIIIQARDKDVINKIVDRGITLTIKRSKSDKDNMSFTFPVSDGKNPLFFNLKNPMDDGSVNAADSLIMRYNKTLEKIHKLIRITGVEDVDTLISIYNENGIKTKEAFDNKKAYTFEMAIKLKHIGPILNDKKGFYYQLKVNGRPSPPITSYIMANGAPPPSPEVLEAVMAQANAKMNIQSGATYFDSEYTLAKKP